MINVLVLALASAISPTILAVVIIVLNRPNNPRRLLSAYLFGGMLTSIAVGAAIVSSLNGLAVLSGPSPAADPIVNFTVAALAFLVAYVLLTQRDVPFEERRRERRADSPPRDPWSERVMSRGTTPIAFVVGVALSLPGAFYLVALKDIAQGLDGIGAQILAIVLFNVIMFAFAEVPLLGYSFAPEATTRRVEEFNGWLARHARQIVTGVAIAMGVYLTTRGVLGLI